MEDPNERFSYLHHEHPLKLTKLSYSAYYAPPPNRWTCQGTPIDGFTCGSNKSFYSYENQCYTCSSSGCSFQLCLTCYAASIAEKHPTHDHALTKGTLSYPCVIKLAGCAGSGFWRCWATGCCLYICQNCLETPIPNTTKHSHQTFSYVPFPSVKHCPKGHHPSLPKVVCRSAGAQCIECPFKICLNCLPDRTPSLPMPEFDPNTLLEDAWSAIISTTWNHDPTTEPSLSNMARVSHSMLEIVKRFVCQTLQVPSTPGPGWCVLFRVGKFRWRSQFDRFASRVRTFIPYISIEQLFHAKMAFHIKLLQNKQTKPTTSPVYFNHRLVTGIIDHFSQSQWYDLQNKHQRWLRSLCTGLFIFFSI